MASERLRIAVSEQQHTASSAFSQYLAIARRRGWVVVLCLIVLPTLAYFYERHQPALYQGSAVVLLNPQNLADALTGVPNSSLYTSQPSRIPDDDAQIARSPSVATKVLAAVPAYRGGTGSFLGASAVVTNSNTDTLIFQVSSRNTGLAVQLTNAYANGFIAFRRYLDTEAVLAAEADVRARLTQSSPHTSLYGSLVSRLDQLQTLDALQTSNAELVASATSAPKIRPRPTRDAIIGAILGLGLGLALALLFDAIDTRVRSSDEVRDLTGFPLLGLLPPPDRRRFGPDVGLLPSAGSRQAESFQLLRVAISFALAQHSAQLHKPGVQRTSRTPIVLVTSAMAGEGKTTTAAGLAAALSWAHQRVTVVDFDLRRPRLATGLGVPDTPGLADVLVGDVMLDDVITAVTIGDGDSDNSAPSASANHFSSAAIQVVPPGVRPPPSVDLGTFGALPEVLDDLRAHADVILVDSPPLTQVSDALSLTPHVDAVIVVARPKLVNRRALNDLVRLLGSAPVPVLGFVATGIDSESGYYGYGYGKTRGEESQTPEGDDYTAKSLP